MNPVRLLPVEKLGKSFVPEEHIPSGGDEHYLRNQQAARLAGYWRHLRADEIETLVKNANTCDNWDLLLVADPFTPQLIKNCEFFGLVRIGKLERVILECHDLKVRVGITDSLIVSCDIGDNVAIHNVRYLAHFILGDHVMLLNVDEMSTTNHAKFGNGIVKDGEPETVRIWLDLMNEMGGRAVMPFDGMITADVWLWAKYRDDRQLTDTLREITQNQFDSRRGFYGTIGDGCVVKNSRILKDVKIGPSCYVKGANKLKNLTINSSSAEPTQIGEGVELVNGVIGFGCHVFYGCKAVRFVMGNNAKLKYGARLIHSFLGDNSTVSCCEILNSLIFPAHEQHHNNSFLIASVVMGQSNLAAGATVGSNHNSRANDGEIQAGRGFWPGLCTTLKHSSRFASFTLLAKGNYPAELDIPLPFSLVSNDETQDRLILIPAYWWMHNMHALARNTWKFQTRDQRKTKAQKIEFDALAPDTVEEIFQAKSLLEQWTATAYLQRTAGANGDGSRGDLGDLGRKLLLDAESQTADLEILGERIENSTRKVTVLKARRAYHAYRQMLIYYAVRNLLDHLRDHGEARFESMVEQLTGPRQRRWVNLGGQLMPEEDLDRLRADIVSGQLRSWLEIHDRYERLWARYLLEKRRHALATLLDTLGEQQLTPDLWNRALDEAMRIQEYICEQVYLTRKKDHDNPFRQITFRNSQEMHAVVGTPEENAFVRQVRAETESLRQLIHRARQRAEPMMSAKDLTP